MNTNEFDAIVLSRRSIRRFGDRAVNRELVHQLLHLATQAPSAHNRQPWRFVVLYDERSRQELARAMGKRLRADRRADGDPWAAVDRDVSRSERRIIDGPVAILVCLTMGEMDRYPDQQRNQAEHLMAVQSTAMAGQNLLLAAHAHGLGACWMCAPLFAPEVAREALGLEASLEPQGLILVGWPSEQGRERERKPVHEVAEYRG